MLSHPLRRAISACASALLVLGLIQLASAPEASATHTVTVRGEVTLGGTKPPSRLTIRAYREVGADEWKLAAQTVSTGEYSFYLEAGTYRVTFNEVEQAAIPAASRDFESKSWTAGDEPDGASEFVVEGSEYGMSIGATDLKYNSGVLQGSFGDQCANPDTITVTAYAADDVAMAYGSTQNISRGTYSLRTLGGPTKFKLDSTYYPDMWVGGDSFESATTFSQQPADSVGAGPDINAVRQIDTSTTSRIEGQIHGPELTDGDVVGLVVRIYRSEFGADGPWTFVDKQTTTSSGFYFHVKKAGVYRVTYNEIDDGSAISRLHAPVFYGGNDLATAANICADTRPGGANLRIFHMPRSGGTVAGTVTDPQGEPIPDVKVEGYEGSPTDLISTAVTDEDGTYELAVSGNPTKVRFSRNADEHLPEWSGDASDFASASTVSASVGETSEHDVVLTTAPLRALSKPTLSGTGTIRYVKTGYSVVSEFFPSTSVKTYQWRRTKGGVTRNIAGANLRTYFATGSDLGWRISVVMTVTPPPGNIDPAPQTFTLTASTTVRSRAKATISAKSSHRRVTVKARISQPALSKPSGTAYVSWVPLKLKGNRLYADGRWKTKKVYFRYGQLSYTFKASRKGYWGYEVYIPESPSKLSYAKSSYIKVK